MVLALAGGLLGLVQGTSNAAVPTRGPAVEDSKLSLNASPRTLDYGKTIVVTGKLLVAADNTPLPDEPVILSQRLFGQDSFRVVDTDLTNAEGVYSFRVKAKRFVKFRAAFDGNGTQGASESTIDEVQVRRVVKARLSDARIKVGERTRLYGQIAPKQRGVDIAAFVKAPTGKWKPFIVEKTGRNGTFNWPMTSTRKGRFVIRVATRASDGLEAGVSRQLILRAR